VIVACGESYILVFWLWRFCPAMSHSRYGAGRRDAEIQGFWAICRAAANGIFFA
jgi:hypothetical protein